MSDNLDDIKKMMEEQKSKPKAQPKARPAAQKLNRLRERMEDVDLDAAKAAATRKTASAAEAAPGYVAEHTVVSGDTLSGIAQKYYGSQANWKRIYEANKEIIGDNPNLIRVGQVFKIPKLD